VTRKDYILIARALNSSRIAVIGKREEDFESGRKLACQALADYLETDNSRFDRERFLKACGVQS
jgi:hypothetical protein